MAANRMSDPCWSAADVALAAGGAWRAPPADGAALIAGVSIDTRTIRPGELFVALRGERFDGHDFIQQALDQGAAGALVDRHAPQLASFDADAPLLLSDDPLTALQRWARVWRDTLRRRGCTVIAVAGSNGKTTTRHLIHHLLHDAPCRSRARGALRGTQSPKSFNNAIGVPVTLLGANGDDDFTVVEIGTNRPGEVAQLAEIVRPDMAVVVSVGREHLEAFKTLERVAEEELSLLRFVEPGGSALIPDADWLGPWLPELSHDLRVQRIAADRRVARAVSLPGDHAAQNAAAAAQVARWMNVDEARVTAALATAEPVPGRFAVRRLGALTLIDDAYNANPDSVRAAVATVCAHWPRAARRVLVLGDMKELGDAAEASHREIGRLVAQTEPGFALVLSIGPLARLAAEEVRRLSPQTTVRIADQWDAALSEDFAGMLSPGDVVLIKGSRSMRLERMIPALEAAFDKDMARHAAHGEAPTLHANA